MTELTREKIFKMRPPLASRPYKSGKWPQFQMSAPGERGRARRATFRIPREEIAALDAFSDAHHGGNRSAAIRTAVDRLAIRLGLATKSDARLKVEETARVLGRDPDKLARELDVFDVPFHHTLTRLAHAGALHTRSGSPSKTRALRWAVRVYLAEQA